MEQNKLNRKNNLTIFLFLLPSLLAVAGSVILGILYVEDWVEMAMLALFMFIGGVVMIWNVFIKTDT